MSERAEPCDASQATDPVDDYNTRRLGAGRFEVYRVLRVKPGGVEVHYCVSKTIDAALLIAKALNIVATMNTIEGVESLLGQARSHLSEAQYLTLLSNLSSAANLAAEVRPCFNCEGFMIRQAEDWRCQICGAFEPFLRRGVRG